MTERFTESISDWASWSRVHSSRAAFAPLAREILLREGLEPAPLEDCLPGTHGVFRSGPYVIKVFVPLESGYDSTADYEAEHQSLIRANEQGFPAPELIADGTLDDRYLFRYLIMAYVAAPPLVAVRARLSPGQKTVIGQNLRDLVQTWSACGVGGRDADVLSRTRTSLHWKDAPETLKADQRCILEDLQDVPRVAVHGDLTADNLLVDADGHLTVIDFADACRAPSLYEDAPILFDSFRFDRHFLDGYCGIWNRSDLADHALRAVLCHEFGLFLIRQAFGPVADAETLHDRIRKQLDKI